MSGTGIPSSGADIGPIVAPESTPEVDPLEDAVADHPKVDEVVVIGVPDDTWGTVGKAVVEGDESLTLDELDSFLEDRLAGFKHPRGLAFVDEMPTSGPSKIDRDAVREAFGDAAN